jgi:hypothetical protein
MHDEIMKHTKKAYAASKNTSLSFWVRLREILIEIAIIVFAVTLSIWLHDRNEHKHEQAQVKQFLVGLKQDLMSDIKEMRADSETYVQSSRAFQYFTGLVRSTPDKDSLKKYFGFLTSTTALVPNNGRYEGFKSSGKLINIEDQELQNNISDLYSESYPSLLNSTDAYIKRKERLMSFYIEKKITNADGTNNLMELFADNVAQNVFVTLVNVDEILSRYSAALTKARQIIAAIDDYD